MLARNIDITMTCKNIPDFKVLILNIKYLAQEEIEKYHSSRYL